MARRLSPFNICMRKKLKGHLRGKSKAERKAIFRKAAHACSR